MCTVVSLNLSEARESDLQLNPQAKQVGRCSFTKRPAWPLRAGTTLPSPGSGKRYYNVVSLNPSEARESDLPYSSNRTRPLKNCAGEAGLV